MRIRQIVFAARELAPTSAMLSRLLALDAPYADPGVAEFGLHNAVYVFGDQFIEIVSPTQDGTTAGRLIERRGDCGYMLILQTDDFDRERSRFTALGLRTVFEAAYDDIRAVHLHPKDIGGAIVSVDQPLPAGAWRWGGPGWKLQDGRAAQQRVVGVSVAAADPAAMARRWAEVLGLAAPIGQGLAWTLALDGGAVDFVPADARGEGIVGYTLAVADKPAVLARAAALGLAPQGDRFMLMGAHVGLRALQPSARM